MTKTILDRDAKVLRQTAKSVALKDIGSKKLGEIIAKMRRALHAENDGVAIAAPQIGASLRIFVVKGGVIPRIKDDKIFINPEITKTSKKKSAMEEGCLSVRWLYGSVERFEKVTITAWNEDGEKITSGASGLLAQIYQHEIDHLDGILFIDKATNVRDLPPTNESSS